MKNPILIYIIFLFSGNTVGQDLFLDAMITKDSVLLRWAPSTVQCFDQGSTYGYVLESIPWNGSTFEIIDTILPADKLRVERIIEEYSEDEAALVAAYYLYGERQKGNRGFSNIGDGFQNFNDEQINLNLVLTAADLSSQAAQILGLRYKMKLEEPTTKSILRLRSIGEGKLDTASYLLTGEPTYYPTIEGVEIKQNGEILEVSWDNIQYQNHYTGYDVFRSYSFNGPFAKVNDAPIFQGDANARKVVLKDSVEIGKMYYYKVRGLTSFGTKQDFSEPKNFKVVEQKVGFRAFGMKARGNHENIRVEWDSEVKDMTSIQTIKLLKSNNYEGPYEEIGKGQITTTTKKFTDKNIHENRSHFYRIAAQNNDGYWYHSNPIRAVYEDVVAPSIPIDLVGVIDSNGICFIHWKANEEKDLKGYRVYKSNRKKGTYFHVHDLLNYTNTFTDTVGVKYLTEEIYYKVVAVDFDNNHSEYSDILRLERPDLVSPVPAQIFDYEMVDQGVKIHIHNSPSKDVVQCFLIKSYIGSQDSTMLEIDKDQSFFIDQNFVDGEHASYVLQTIDDAGNISMSRIITIKSKNKRSLVRDVDAKYEDGHVVLNWTILNNEKGHLLIYLQSVQDEKFEFLSKSPSEEKEVSIRLFDEGDYKIACVFIDENGKRFPPTFSNAITVEE